MEQAVLQNWEYHVEELNSLDDVNQVFSRLGSEGWELVNVAGGSASDTGGPVKTLRRKNETYKAFFKRPAD